MPLVKAAIESEDRHSDTPIIWFAELVSSIDTRDVYRAAHSLRQLKRLGFNVDPRMPATEQGGSQ